MTASSTTAMIGQIQSCFFRNSPVRVIDRPTEVWPNVMCDCPWPSVCRVDCNFCQSQVNMGRVEGGGGECGV